MKCLFPFPIIQRCLRKSSIALFLILITNSAWANSTIQLDWESSPSPNVNGYQVYMGKTPGAYSTMKDTGLTQSAQFSNMPDGQTYYFSVTAYDQHHNESTPSTEVSVTVPDSTVPEAPQGIILTSASSTEVALEWAAATDNVGVTAYEIARDNTVLGQTLSTTYTDSSVKSGNSYHYRVRAKDAAGNTSEWSQPLQVQTPQAMVQLTVSTTGNGSVTSSPTGIDCPQQSCISTYPPDTMIDLTATPEKDWAFSGWSGKCSGTGSCTVTLAEAATITASFTKASPSKPGKGIGRGIMKKTAMGNQVRGLSFAPRVTPQNVKYPLSLISPKNAR